MNVSIGPFAPPPPNFSPHPENLIHLIRPVN